MLMAGRNHDKGSKYHGQHCKIQPAVNHRKKKKKALEPRLSTDILLEELLELIYVYTEIDLHRMWVHACTFGSGLQH